MATGHTATGAVLGCINDGRESQQRCGTGPDGLSGFGTPPGDIGTAQGAGYNIRAVFDDQEVRQSCGAEKRLDLAGPDRLSRFGTPPGDIGQAQGAGEHTGVGRIPNLAEPDLPNAFGSYLEQYAGQTGVWPDVGKFFSTDVRGGSHLGGTPGVPVEYNWEYEDGVEQGLSSGVVWHGTASQKTSPGGEKIYTGSNWDIKYGCFGQEDIKEFI